MGWKGGDGGGLSVSAFVVAHSSRGYFYPSFVTIYPRQHQQQCLSPTSVLYAYPRDRQSVYFPVSGIHQEHALPATWTGPYCYYTSIRRQEYAITISSVPFK